jgi:hypothetical protein
MTTADPLAVEWRDCKPDHLCHAWNPEVMGLRTTWCEQTPFPASAVAPTADAAKCARCVIAHGSALADAIGVSAYRPRQGP